MPAQVILDLSGPGSPHPLLDRVGLKTVARKIVGVLHIRIHLDEHMDRFFESDAAFFDPFDEQVRVDRALVDVKQRDVVVEHLVEKDDELDEIRVCLLPEGFLAAPVEVIEERGDPVGESVGFEVVVQRIVAIGRVEAHLDEVRFASVPRQDLPHLVAEVAFHFEHEAADALPAVVVPVGEDLLRKRVHAAARLAATDGPEDPDSRVETPLRNREPVWLCCLDRLLRMVHLADNNRQLLAARRLRVARQPPFLRAPVEFHGEDVRERNEDRCRDPGGCEPQGDVGRANGVIHERLLKMDQFEHGVVFREWLEVPAGHPDSCRDQSADERPALNDSA